VALEEHELADFTSAFRQRFAALFGRKIARQRAEQYLAGLLGGRASRRNVTSLAQTIDGATARSLGWLLNKSPWATRPIVDAVHTYVAEEIGSASGIFSLSLDSFVKRGDNAVGVAKQYVAHLGRTLNCQIGVFLTYGSPGGSALVDAALYLPHEWIDSPLRRQRAGVPDDVAYATRVDLALDLLGRTRDAGKLRGHWVTVQQSEGFEPELRARLEADGWWYLLPVAPSQAVFTDHDDVAPHSVSDLLAEAGAGLTARRVWESVDRAPSQPRWLVCCPEQQTGVMTAFFSNAPETVTLDAFERAVATYSPTATCETQRDGASLDVYRVRGWDGWHRHVTLALLASAFRACLALESADTVEAPAEAAARVDMDVILPEEITPEIVLVERAPLEAIDVNTDDDAAATAVSDESAAMQRVPTTYRLHVQIEETDWRAVRAFQTLLVAQEAGEVLSSSPTRADIERQEVAAEMNVVFESDHSVEQIMAALGEVPEIRVVSLAAQTEAAAASPADAFFAAGDADDRASEDLGDPSDLLAALEAELSIRTVAREAGLPSPTEEAAEVVAARVSNIQAAAAKAEPRPERVVGSNGSANGGGNGPAVVNSSVLAPIEPPAPPVSESPARSVPPAANASPARSVPPAANASVAPSAPVTPVAPSADAPEQAVNGSSRHKEPVRIDEEQVIVLDVANESYGMPVQRVREIIRVPPITRVPNGPAFLEGVINLRGQVIPVLDLRKHLGVEATAHTRRSRVVVGELGEYTVGMVVDAVSQVVMVPASNVEPPPSLVSSAENGQVRGVARLGDRLVLLLDPDRVLSKR
jgi:chemotaxis signal transduction protein